MVYCGQDPRPILSRPALKSRKFRYGYRVEGRYPDMPEDPNKNGDRGRFRLRLMKDE
jgi:hypothetical protein